MLEANGNAPEVDTQIDSLVAELYEPATVDTYRTTTND
jgi:hypothetical protein